ncbi:DODA-type extradiol aromatic ring-opening family dioxygenase [Paraburkholderia megapolitana]|jgi:2,3-dihydroxyphenylpropionate 1,2-dioxygenase|uniref:DODA-type extradiol aromatic ring-opening family dioxygenase n=1 Tax=Paraburkholderia megapolitana TaxID=420953 RepID=UPI0038BC6824
MTAMLICVSHSPITLIRAKAPEREPEILSLYERTAQEVASFDPELVVVFASDHFAGFHYSLMPSYCVGLEASAVADVGGFGGEFRVPRETVLSVVQALMARGFDPAVSHRMKVDHAFSQPVHRLCGSLDRYPVIPIFLNAIAAPMLSFGRARLLGVALGEIFSNVDARILVIASGGLSHHPTRYYPALGSGSPEVEAWQMSGPDSGMSSDAWFDKLKSMHEEGANMLIDGRRTVRDIRLNEAFDERFMDLMCATDISVVDNWATDSVIEEAGIGAMELNAWTAGWSTYRQLQSAPVRRQIYVPALEYGIGYGMVVAGGVGTGVG